MDEKLKDAVERYQCPGCVCGSDISCYENVWDIQTVLSCSKHVAGTSISNIGRIFLGMPKGFNRLGFCDKMTIHIFKAFKDGWGYDFLNVPVWKIRDEHGNTIVRGICPRTNYAWIHIFLEDCIEQISCHWLTDDNLKGMD
jgi:hypothetical protein